MSQSGRPGRRHTDPTGFYNSEFFVPLKPRGEWPDLKQQTGWMGLFREQRPRTKEELVTEMNDELSKQILGVNWNFSQNIRDNVMESLSGVKGDNSVKIFGPDLDKLELLAEQVKSRLSAIKGIESVGVFRTKGQPNLEIPIDPQKCSLWGVSVADVEDVIQTATVRAEARVNDDRRGKTVRYCTSLARRIAQQRRGDFGYSRRPLEQPGRR